MFDEYVNLTKAINDMLRQVEKEAIQNELYPPTSYAKEAASIILEEILITYDQYLMVYPISHSIVIDISLRDKSSVVFVCVDRNSIVNIVNGINGGRQCFTNYPDNANSYDLNFVNNLVNRSLNI